MPTPLTTQQPYDRVGVKERKGRNEGNEGKEETKELTSKWTLPLRRRMKAPQKEDGIE